MSRSTERPRDPPPEVRWPAERFYWALLDAPGWSKAGRIPAGLLPLLGDEIPVPPEELHAVGSPTGDGRALVCAAARDNLQAIDPRVLSLTPANVPGFAAALAEPTALELLVGRYEPRPIRRARRTRRCIALLALGISTCLIITGLLRRAQVWQSEADRRKAAVLALTDAYLPGVAPESLPLELLKLREAGPAPRSITAPPDAALAMAEILTIWPDQAAAKPQSLNVSGNSASLAVVVEGDPIDFLKLLRSPDGWLLDEPRFNSAGGATRINLQLRREGGQ